MRLRDLTGETFGRLTVVERGANTPRGDARWVCRCECGSETLTRGTDLTKGHTKSCGCTRTVGVVKDEPGYIAAHQRVHRERGKAKYQACVDCGAPAEEWSYDGTDPDELHQKKNTRGNVSVVAYSAKPEHYSPRCRSCHRAFDGVVYEGKLSRV